jgi:hypothetical protein
VEVAGLGATMSYQPLLVRTSYGWCCSWCRDVHIGLLALTGFRASTSLETSMLNLNVVMVWYGAGLLEN